MTNSSEISNSNLLQKQRQIVADFAPLNDWEDRYKKIITLGKALPELPENLKTEESKVKGCQSQVWLHAELNDKGQVLFRGDSDALLVRGLVALLIEVYNFATPKEILSTAPEFIKEIGFESHLSPSRANGLNSMLKQIRNFATVFDYMLARK
jgi:cysteine desulfuration protein SufE